MDTAHDFDMDPWITEEVAMGVHSSELTSNTKFLLTIKREI